MPSLRFPPFPGMMEREAEASPPQPEENHTSQTHALSVSHTHKHSTEPTKTVAREAARPQKAAVHGRGVQK